MNQITIVSACEVDGEGFRQRLQGRGVRDCILVLSSEGISLGLLHKELSSRTFVEEEIRGNKGALNIDSCRVTSSGDHKRPFQPTNSDRDIYGKQVGFHPTNSEGRFPANLILMHDSECEKIGSKKVKSGTAHQDKKVLANKVYQGEWDPQGVSGKAGYASEDGTETVDNWECVAHCPVGLLDDQSGVLGNGFRPNFASAIGGQVSFVVYEISKGIGRSSMGYPDNGGASRFFKQVTSREELQSYFDSMVRI